MVTSIVALVNASDQPIFVTDIITVEMGLMKLIAVSSSVYILTYACMYMVLLRGNITHARNLIRVMSAFD